MKRVDSKTDDESVQCRIAIESSLHAVIECPRNKEIIWLGNHLGKMGVVGNIASLIPTGPTPKNRDAALLVATFVLWEHRREMVPLGSAPSKGNGYWEKKRGRGRCFSFYVHI